MINEHTVYTSNGVNYKIHGSINGVTDESRLVCKFLAGDIALLSVKTRIPRQQS